MEDNREMFMYINRRFNFLRKLRFVSKLYSALGLSLSVISSGYFIFTLFPYDLSREQRVALLAAGVGVMMAVLSRILILFEREREAEMFSNFKTYEKIMKFLDAWGKFEKVSKDVLSKDKYYIGYNKFDDYKKIDTYNKYSLRSIVKNLYDEKKIGETDVIALEEALKARNLIVHGENFSSLYSPKSFLFSKDIDIKTDALDNIVRKLSQPET